MKIGIVGSGLVGSTSAYAMVMRGIGREIILVDKNERRAEAEANDILHAVPFSHPLVVRTGDYSHLENSRAVVISAGASQRPGETRLDLLRRNARVFDEIVPEILKTAPDAVLVVTTNPVDIMTHLTALRASDFGVPKARVIGTGTTLDTARFRALLGRYLGVDPQHVHGYVVGEHGDSEVLTWSLVSIGGLGLTEFCRKQGLRLEASGRESIDHSVRGAAYSIIEGKGATYYGIGSAVAKIVDVILHDQRSILTVSAYTSETARMSDVSLSLPRLIGGEGVLATFPLQLDDSERAQLTESAGVVRQAIESLGL